MAAAGSASPAPAPSSAPAVASPAYSAAGPSAPAIVAYPAQAGQQNYPAAGYGYNNNNSYGYNAAGPAYPGGAGYGYGANGGAVAGPSGYAYGGANAGYDAYGAAGYGYNYGYDGYGQGGEVAGSYDTSHEEFSAQQSIYTPGSVPQEEPQPKPTKGEARRTVLRKGAGEVWEDKTLMEWDPAHFRLFIGDLGNDVNEDDLVKAFGPGKGWKSFVKAKVVRDNVTNKTRGYGFVAYSDPEDFMKAWKAMDGKYVGSRPIKIKKATTQVRQVDIGAKKAKDLDTKKKRPVHLSNKVRGTINPSAAWKPYIRR